MRALNGDVIKSAQVISEEEDIPKEFLYKIMKKLEKENLVTVFRGQTGGYVSKESIYELTILDIMKIFKVTISINDCMKEEFKCNRKDEKCKLHQEFRRVQDKIDKELSMKKIKDILNE